MADTEFSAFAQKMAVVFRGDEPPEAFAKALFAAIYRKRNTLKIKSTTN